MSQSILSAVIIKDQPANEVIGVYCTNHTKYVNTLCGKMPNFFMLQQVAFCTCYWPFSD